MTVNQAELARALRVERSVVSKAITRLCSPEIGILEYASKRTGSSRTAHAVVALRREYRWGLVPSEHKPCATGAQALCHQSTSLVPPEQHLPLSKEEIKKGGEEGHPESASPVLEEVRTECTKLYDVVCAGTRTRPPAPEYFKAVWLMLQSRKGTVGEMRRMCAKAAQACRFLPKPIELLEFFTRQRPCATSRADSPASRNPANALTAAGEYGPDAETKAQLDALLRGHTQPRMRKPAGNYEV